MQKYYTDKREEEAIKTWAESKLSGISKLFKDKKVLISQGRKKEIFLVSEELFEVYKKIEKKQSPMSIGSFFGVFDGKDLKLSLEAIYEYSKISDYHKVVINRKFEQKFLHGRNPHSQAIVSYDETLEQGDMVVICNSLNEALGAGIVTGDFRSKNRVQVIKNMMDRGFFLRNKE